MKALVQTIGDEADMEEEVDALTNDLLRRRSLLLEPPL
jgi:hypothetical protein